MKELNQAPEEILNKMGTSNPTDAELKTLVITLLNDYMDNFNKKIGSVKIKVENIKNY